MALDLGGSIGATPLGAQPTRPPWITCSSSSPARPGSATRCAGSTGRVNFFPGRGESLEPARALCAACLVRPECLLYALEHDEPHGVWGGLSARERHELNASNTGGSSNRLLEGPGLPVRIAIGGQ